MPLLLYKNYYYDILIQQCCIMLTRQKKSQIRCIPYTVTDLLAVIVETSNLHNIVQTALGDGVMKAEAHLTELDLSDNAFGPDGVKAVTALLTSPSCFSLKVLKFNNNGLGSKGGSVSHYKYSTT